MEINKYNEIFFKVGQKYSFSQVDTNSDNVLSKEEVLKIAYLDEELCAELSDEDLALIKDLIPTVEKNNENKSDISNIENTSTTTETKTKDDGKIVTTTYNAQGKPTSAISTDKDGVVRKTTYQYNDDGTSVKTTINTETGAKNTTTYNENGEKIRKEKEYSVIWGDFKLDRYDINEVYEYNSDGSYTKTEIKNWYKYSNDSKKIRLKDVDKKYGMYDSSGNLIKGDPDAAVQQTTEWFNTLEKVAKDDYRPTLKNEYKKFVKEKGTTIVVFGNNNCGACVNTVRSLNKHAQELDGAGINVVYANGVQQHAHPDLYEYSEKFNTGVGLPIVIKFIDGEPVAHLNENNLFGTAENALAEINEPYCINSEYEKKLHTGQEVKLEEVLDYIFSTNEQFFDESESHGNLWLAVYNKRFADIFELIEKHIGSYDEKIYQDIKNFLSVNADEKIDDIKPELLKLWYSFFETLKE